MTEDKKLKGPVDVIITKPDGQKVSYSSPPGSFSGEIVSGSTGNAQLTLSQQQHNSLVDRLNALEDFAQSLEEQDRTVTDTWAVAVTIGLLPKVDVSFQRSITKKQKS